MTSATANFFKDIDTGKGVELGISALRQSLEQIYSAREAVPDRDAVGLIEQINRLSSEVFPNLSNPDDKIKTLDAIAHLAQDFSDRYGDFFLLVF